MKIRFLTLANQEVDDAVIWYDKQVGGLGREFLDELDRSVRLVRTYPEASTEIEPGIRRCLLARFPYSMVYGIDQETVVVIAVAHLHREPVIGRIGSEIISSTLQEFPSPPSPLHPY